jgi:hypothetical protein
VFLLRFRDQAPERPYLVSNALFDVRPLDTVGALKLKNISQRFPEFLMVARESFLSLLALFHDDCQDTLTI